MAQEEPATKRARTDSKKSVVELDGESLTTDVLWSLSTGNFEVKLSGEARAHAGAGRAVVDKISKSGEIVYGINTGFGLFANVTVSNDQLSELQENLIRSHSSGVGAPLTRNQSRMLLALRINVLAKGHSGISLEVLDQMIAAFNADCLPVIPSKGTVGASGDLAPLAHLALGLMGEGHLWDPSSPGCQGNAAEVLAKHGLRPIRLGAKEGLAMINGTQLIASLGSEAISRAERVAKTADVVCALTLEVLCGTVRAYHPLIHAVRPHNGQQAVARRVRTLLQPDAPSELFKSHGYVGKVQDAYSLRCVPQVHGVVNDTIQFVQNLMNTELNSATDNPMVFTREQADAAEPMGFNVTTPLLTPTPSKFPRKLSFYLEPAADEAGAKQEDASDVQSLQAAREEIAALRKSLAEQKPRNWSFFKKPSDIRYNGDGGMILSGGNFHGEYPAKAMDYLAIGVHELAAISERRIERLCNPSLSGLPAFLVKEGGLNSGFMIAHCTAAALVSENKVLTHPSSVDSISTSGAKEDHVSMGGFAARKALEVVEHVETVIAIELLAACQALEFHRPLKTTEPLEAVHALVRSKVAPWDKDRHMSPDIEAALKLVQSGAVLDVAEANLKTETQVNGSHK